MLGPLQRSVRLLGLGRGRLLGGLDPGDHRGGEAQQPAAPPGPRARSRRARPPQPGRATSGSAPRCTARRCARCRRRSRTCGPAARPCVVSRMHWQRMRRAQPAQQVRLDPRPRVVRCRPGGCRARRSRAGLAASRARSMPYLAISSAALAVSASASGGVTPASSALASSLRTRSSSLSGVSLVIRPFVQGGRAAMEASGPGVSGPLAGHRGQSLAGAMPATLVVVGWRPGRRSCRRPVRGSWASDGHRRRAAAREGVAEQQGHRVVRGRRRARGRARCWPGRPRRPARR